MIGRYLHWDAINRLFYMKCIQKKFEIKMNALVKTDSDKPRLRRRRKVCLCCCTRLCLPKCLVNKPFNERKKAVCERHEEKCVQTPSFIAVFFIYLAGLSFLTHFSSILVLMEQGCFWRLHIFLFLLQSPVVFELSYFHYFSRAKMCLFAFKTVDF